MCLSLLGHRHLLDLDLDPGRLGANLDLFAVLVPGRLQGAPDPESVDVLDRDLLLDRVALAAVDIDPDLQSVGAGA